MLARQPAVAGHFYPADPRQLKKQVGAFLEAAAGEKKTRPIGVVSPHAGYLYSGHVAGALFAQLDLPRKFIILSPNHTGYGARAAIMSAGEWAMPLGNVPIDVALAAAIRQACPDFEEDTEAQQAEHALEVQLPFLQVLQPAFTFVPLTLTYLPYETCERIGQGLARVIAATKEPILMIASSDLNHYESQKIAEEKDFAAIRQIEACDPRGLYDTVRRGRISMCGIIPATVMLVAARALGATRGTLVKHATSGDVSGDTGSVVGYGALTVS